MFGGNAIHSACATPITSPKIMSNTNTTAATVTYASTARFAAESSGSSLSAIAGPLLCGRNHDLRHHAVMGEAAVLEAQHLVLAGPGKRVMENIGVAGHGLRLGDELQIGVVQPEAVVDVARSDVKCDRLADFDLGCAQFPAPLLPDGADHLRRAGFRCGRRVGEPRQRVTDDRHERNNETPEESGANARGGLRQPGVIGLVVRAGRNVREYP